VTESRRYAVPPLWLVPVLLMAAIGVIVLVSTAWGLLGLVAGVALIAWLERKADVYVRDHDVSPDD
jgi:energy-converting hydrogenase Eha subunit G